MHTMISPHFVHLRLHSEYSITDGIVRIGDAVKHRMDQLEFERDQLNKYVSGG